MTALADGWKSIATAPTDGTWIQAKIPGHGSDNVIAWVGGLLNSAEEECGGWSFMTEQEPPDSWTDGYCWEVNADGEPSVAPTEWKKLERSRRGRLLSRLTINEVLQ